MKCILAIDSGGSKCHAMLLRDDGEVIGWGPDETQTKNDPYMLMGGRTYEAIQKAVKDATNDIEFDDLHIASTTSTVPLDFLRKRQSTRVQMHLVPEYIAAFAQVEETAGVVALAGTGAIAVGVTPDKRIAYLDGLGPILGDHGGGYEIGLRTIRAAAMSGWHPRHATSFAKEVLRMCGGAEKDQRGWSLIRYMTSQHDRCEIAAIAKLAGEAARQGDKIAIGILEDAASALAETIWDAVDVLKIANEPYALVGTGGIITQNDIYWNHLCKRVHEFAPGLRPIRSDLPAIVGVAFKAINEIPGIDVTGCKKRLCDSLRALMSERKAGTKK